MEDSWQLWRSVHNSQVDMNSLADSYTVRASLPSSQLGWSESPSPVNWLGGECKELSSFYSLDLQPIV